MHSLVAMVTTLAPARRFSTVLLDVDGTLVDSNDAHAHAWVETFARYDYDIPFSSVRRLIGMGGDRLISWSRSSRLPTFATWSRRARPRAALRCRRRDY